MGMFDYIKIEKNVEIPLPEEIKFNEIEFQTKSFDNTMSTYVIGDDKKLYVINLEQEDKKELDYHGKFIFYCYEATDLVDYSADFEAKFTDGVLQYIKLINYEKKQHESRKVKHEEMKKRMEENYNKFSNKLKRKIKYAFYLILSAFGIKNNEINITNPEILFLYKPTFSGKKYGIMIENVGTGVYLEKNKYFKKFEIKFLGFGLIINKTINNFL